MSYRQRRTRTLVVAAVLAVAVSGATVPAATGQEPARAVVAAAGPATAVPGFLIQTSAQVSDDSAVSKPGFDTAGCTRSAPARPSTPACWPTASTPTRSTRRT